MKILETEQGWAVEHNGTVPVKIEGTGYFTNKAVLQTAVEKRGLYIWADGSIERTPENPVIPPAPLTDDEEFEAAAPKDSSGAPPTEDPPVDPDADKDRPKPSPKPTAPGNKKAGGKLSGKPTKLPDDSGYILTPEAVKALGGEKAIKAVQKASKKGSASGPAEPARGRGRPRLYTPEEAAERRRQKAKEYAAKRSEEQKAAARERARKWREEHPDKVKATREKSMQSRAQRYANDPEFRKQFNEYQREYKRTKRKAD